MASNASFPMFPDGDVKVVVNPDQQYQLHSNVLKHASPILRSLLADKYAAQLGKKAQRDGIVVRHKLVLINNPSIYDDDDSNPHVPYVFTRVKLDSMGRPVPGSPQGVGFDPDNGRRAPPAFKAFNTIIAALYNQKISLGDPFTDGIAELLENAFQATQIAEYFDCVRVVSHTIESTLLAVGQPLYESISNNSTRWLAFAARVKSRAIFAEALIHSAGQYNSDEVQAALVSGELSDEVIEVLKRKGKWVVKSISDTSRFLASYYPSMLLREVKPGDKDAISRASYGNDIMMWIAVCVFRHFISDLMALDRTHHSKDNGYAFIDVLCQGGDKYCDRKMMKNSFHMRFPMTGKGMACVEHRLSEVKEDIKQWVLPLKKNNTNLDLSQHPQTHFLHVNVHPSDFPWLNEDQVPTKPRGPFQQDSDSDSDDDHSTQPDDDEDDEELALAPMPKFERLVDQEGDESEVDDSDEDLIIGGGYEKGDDDVNMD